MSNHRWTLAAIIAVSLTLIARWSIVWSETPDFTHGWLVPIFAAYVAWERRSDAPLGASSHHVHVLWVVAWLVLAFVGAAGRAVLEPYPTWPAAVWVYSLCGWITIGGIVRFAYGSATARHFAFPILFTATALPWPTWLDVQLIIPLRTLLASLTAEVIHTFGYPAVAHGTLIEVGRGSVGIDEACSGIRSLQASLMISLLLGEIFRLRWKRRAGLVAGGLALAVTTNFARTCLLAWQGAIGGPAAVEHWHDSAGNTLMLVTLGGVAALAWHWRSPASRASDSRSRQNCETESSARGAALVVIATVVVIEAGTRIWFGSAPSTSALTDWTARLPSHARAFKVEPFTANMQDTLRCEAHQVAQWESTARGRRAGYILEWSKGNVARQTITLHNPESCLPGAGQQLIDGDRGSVAISAPNGKLLPFRISEFSGPEGRLFVFYLAWDKRYDRPIAQADDHTGWLWFTHRLAEVWSRRTQFPAEVIAIGIYDSPDLAAARVAFVNEAPSLFASDGSH